MTAGVLLLVVAAAVAHATWNLTIKKAGTSGAGFLWLTFAVGAVVFAPFGIHSLVDSSVDLTRWMLLALVSGALQVGYFLLLQRAYRAADVSVVYPLARGTGPLLSVILAMVLLGERPGPVALAGAAVIVAGVVIIGLAGSRRVRDVTGPGILPGAVSAATRASSRRIGILFGLAVGVLIAAYTLWDSSAVTVGGMPPTGLYWGSVVAQTLILAPAAYRERSTLPTIARAHWIPVLVVGILAPLAYILVLVAVQHAPVSLIAPARETSVVLVSLAGWLLFREPHPVQRLAGAAVVLAGVALLALS